CRCFVMCSSGATHLVSFFFSSRRRHTSSKRDWSSDVCSSDLFVGLLGRLVRQAVDELHRLVEQLDPPDRELDAELVVGGDVLIPLDKVLGHVPGAATVGREDLEIGRASCRERGWVSMVVVCSI